MTALIKVGVDFLGLFVEGLHGDSVDLLDEAGDLFKGRGGAFRVFFSKQIKVNGMQKLLLVQDNSPKGERAPLAHLLHNPPDEYDDRGIDTVFLSGLGIDQ